MPYTETELETFKIISEQVVIFCQRHGFKPKNDYDTIGNLEDAINWLLDWSETMWIREGNLLLGLNKIEDIVKKAYHLAEKNKPDEVYRPKEI